MGDVGEYGRILLKHIFGETDYEGVVCIEIAPVQ
jgi:hypothetical protein